MNKKNFLWFFLGILLVFTFYSVLSFSFDDLEGSVKRVEDIEKKVKMTKEDYKWEVLSEKWQETLLKNPVIAKIDELFKKWNIFFVVFFGKNYSLSLTLLFIIIFWFYFWNQFYKIFSTFSTFSNSTSLLISLSMVIILAQINFFDFFSELLFKFIFYRQGKWGWFWYFISVGVIILLLMVLSRFFFSLKKVVLKLKEESYRKQILGELEQKNKFFSIVAEAFRGMFKTKYLKTFFFLLFYEYYK